MYKKIFERLEDEGIRDPKDLLRYPADYNRIAIVPLSVLHRKRVESARTIRGGFEFLTAATYPWVQDVFEIIDRSYDATLDAYLQRVNIPTLMDSPYRVLGAHSWTVTSRRFERRAKYGCIMPYQCIFLTNQIIARGYERRDGPMPSSACLPEDYLPSLFALKPLLLAGMADLIPRCVNYVDPDDLACSRTTKIYYLRELGKSIVIDDEGTGPKSATKSLPTSERTFNGAVFFIRMPWLLNARVEDFIELAQRYTEEFQLYHSLMLRQVENVSRGESDFDTIARDLQYAMQRLDVLYRNKCGELKSKGVDVAVGTLATLGSLIVPGAQLLAPFVGGKAVWDGVRLFREVAKVEELISHEDSWILWSMKGK